MLIPDHRQLAVDEAFVSVFGRRSVGDFRPISGGVSGAQILRFEAGGRPYVLRLEPERIAEVHRRRGYECMSDAAIAGVAPRVHFADPVTGVAVMDFVAGRPLSEHPEGPMGVARNMGELLARLRTAAPFPDVEPYPDMIAAKLSALAASRHFPPGALARHDEGLARIRSALPWRPEALVSSHNDPNPRNILFDGERLWLVDWELAFLNDPLVDVAIVTTDLARTPALGDALLEATLGRPPDAAVRARLAVMRLMVRLFYGCIVLELFQAAPPPEDFVPATAASPEAFEAAIADGLLKSGAPQTAYAFARMSLNAFVQGLVVPGFDEDLRRASEA